MKIAPIKMKNAFRKIFSGQDRKPRVDKRDLEFARNWIKDGNNGVTRMDNDSVSILVPDTAGTSGWVYLHRFDSVKKAINNCIDPKCSTHSNKLYMKAPTSLKSALTCFLCPEKLLNNSYYIDFSSPTLQYI